MQCNKTRRGSQNNIGAPKIIFGVIKWSSRKTLLFTTTLVILFRIRFSIALWKSIDLNLFASTFKLFLCFFSLLLSLQFSILCIHVQLGENCCFYIIWKSNNFMVSKSEYVNSRQINKMRAQNIISIFGCTNINFAKGS